MARLTQDAYIKGLKQGYALAKSQYEEILRDIKVETDKSDSAKDIKGDD